MTEEKSVWLEVRPLPTGNFKYENLADCLRVLHNIGSTFRFVVGLMESPSVRGKRSIRFFLEVPSRNAEHIANIIRTEMDAEVLPAERPSAQFPIAAKLHLLKDYADPVVPFESREETPTSRVDDLVSALAACEQPVLVEVVAKQDKRAAMHLVKRAGDLLGYKLSFTKALADTASGIPSQIAIDQDYREIHRQAWWTSARQSRKTVSPLTRMRIDAILKKAQQPLFLCDVNVYGHDARDVESIIGALPSHTNKFVKMKTEANVEAPPTETKPRKHLLRQFLASLWPLPAVLVLATSWRLGFFQPLRLETPEFVTITIAACATVFYAALVKRVRPIVLSLKELTALVGLPVYVEKLPVEWGVKGRTIAKGFPPRAGLSEAKGEVEKAF